MDTQKQDDRFEITTTPTNKYDASKHARHPIPLPEREYEEPRQITHDEKKYEAYKTLKEAWQWDKDTGKRNLEAAKVRVSLDEQAAPCSCVSRRPSRAFPMGVGFELFVTHPFLYLLPLHISYHPVRHCEASLRLARRSRDSKGLPIHNRFDVRASTHGIVMPYTSRGQVNSRRTI